MQKIISIQNSIITQDIPTTYKCLGIMKSFLFLDILKINKKKLSIINNFVPFTCLSDLFKEISEKFTLSIEKIQKQAYNIYSGKYFTFNCRFG